MTFLDAIKDAKSSFVIGAATVAVLQAAGRDRDKRRFAQRVLGRTLAMGLGLWRPEDDKPTDGGVRGTPLNRPRMPSVAFPLLGGILAGGWTRNAVEGRVRASVAKEAQRRVNEWLVRNGECRARDPSHCSYHGGKREGETAGSSDRHGTTDTARLLADGGRQNRERAKSVITGIAGKKSGFEPKAFYREDTGWIGIDYGVAGNPNNEYQGGHGLAHIMAKHPGAERKLVELFEKGECYKHDIYPNKLYLVKGNSVAVVTKLRSGRLLITSYEELRSVVVEALKKRGKYHIRGEN